MSDHWQDNLRKRMDLHEENAPEGLWKDIEQHIDTFNPVHIVKPRRKILLWSLSSVAVAAVAILLLVLSPFNNQSPLLPTTDLVVSEIIDQTDVAESIVSESIEVESAVVLKPLEEKLLSQSKQSVSAQQQYNNVSVQIPAVENDNAQLTEINKTDNKTITENKTIIENETITKNEPITEKEAITDNKTITEESTKNEALDSKVDKVQSKQDKPQPNDQLLALSTKGKSPKQSKWQTNLSMSNVSSSSSETHTGFGTFAQHETVEDQYAFMSQYTRAEAYTEIDHNLPIMVGLTFRYNINQRWGVSSGLTYSLLTSKLRSESVNYFYDDRQTLHYLGVPLNIDYKLWQNNNFSTYISAGGLVEKNIAGKLSSNYYIDNKLQSSTDEKITSKQLQWSINSAVGLEYRISDNFGIYAEPGVAYYFKNNSEIETIYKERPFNFNLKLGLRINFND
jgi:hypothetical protein